MEREKRMRRITAMSKYLAKFAQEDELSKLDELPYISSQGQFGNEEVYIEDWSMQFSPQDLNDAIRREMNKAWITLPSAARKAGSPNLYFLNPAKASEHEKYFGLKTPYGYIQTPATAALHHAALYGKMPRGDLSGLKKLEIPPDYPGSPPSDFLLTLPASVERGIINSSFRFMEEAHERPELLRRMTYNLETGRIDTTTSHSRGIREVSVGTPTLERRQELLERGLVKGIGSYPELNRMGDRFAALLDAKIDALLKEQAAVNRTVRFEGSREETQDILKQNVARLLIERLFGPGGPLEGTELGLLEDIRIPS